MKLKTRKEVLRALARYFSDNERIFSEPLLKYLEENCLIIYAGPEVSIEDEIKNRLED